MVATIVFRNGRDVDVISPKRPPLVVSNWEQVYTDYDDARYGVGMTLPQRPYEFVGFRVDNRMLGIQFSYSSTQMASVYAKWMPVSVRIDWAPGVTYKALRFRSITTCDRLGLSNSTYGIRMWDTSVSPRKLVYDSGYRLVQRENELNAELGKLLYLPNNYYYFPFRGSQRGSFDDHAWIGTLIRTNKDGDYYRPVLSQNLTFENNTNNIPADKRPEDNIILRGFSVDI